MADLTDEEKAQKLAAEVENQGSDEAAGEAEQPTNQEDEATEESNVEEQNSETAEESPTFTKQFTNLKGESWDEYGKELETAYQNSTAEAIRLKKQLDDNNQLVERAKALLDNSEVQPQDKAQFDINSLPEIQQLRAEQQSKMVEAFDTFAAKYPQARDTDGFDQFQKASNGASQAFAAAFNRVPTYPELFEKTAQLLGWQPSDKNARKDAAIKDAAAAPSTQNAAPKNAPKTNVTAAQLEMARKFWPDKKESELIKELSQTLN